MEKRCQTQKLKISEQQILALCNEDSSFSLKFVSVFKILLFPGLSFFSLTSYNKTEFYSLHSTLLTSVMIMYSLVQNLCKVKSQFLYSGCHWKFNLCEIICPCAELTWGPTRGWPTFPYFKIRKTQQSPLSWNSSLKSIQH